MPHPVAFGLASLAVSPPAAGFSKWYLALGSMDIHNNILLAVLMGSSLLNACYFVPIVLTSFFGDPPAGETETGSLEGGRWVPFMVLFATAIASVDRHLSRLFP
jgi:multicomponent Na+:H+ antiporter subunit D